MFNNNKTSPARPAAESTTLIASGTSIKGDVAFTGHLHLDGSIEGSIRGADGNAVLTLSESASVQGELHAPRIVINGKVVGDVVAGERLELASNARVEGNIHYRSLEMSAGAQINGKMVFQAEPPRQLPKPDASGEST